MRIWKDYDPNQFGEKQTTMYLKLARTLSAAVVIEYFCPMRTAPTYEVLQSKHNG